VDLPERYVWLCLRVNRHVDGFVDACIGPNDWERTVAAEEPVDPHRLRDEAEELLDALGESDLEEDRRRWLSGQLGAIACTTARLVGEDMAWSDEVERCLGVRPQRTDTSVFEDVHRRLDAALPGSGSVRDRYNAWDEANAIDRDRLVPGLERLNDVLGPRARALTALPSGESVAYELVDGVPWIAFNRYEGRFRSRIEVNTDLPGSITLLVTLAAHEAYPGHHTERVAKEARLYRDLGRLETSVVITPSPESVVSEGVALLALETALGPEPFEEVADILVDLGIRFDPNEALEVHRAELALYATATNAAFMLHEDGASTREAAEYLQAWDLESEEKAARTVAFLTDPESRAYVSAYPDGWRLCRDFTGRQPGNFERLLTEQLTTTDLHL
jgi:hypothetical protein